VRLFQLQRDEDASGVSGTGIVAEGVEFADGHCAMRWLTDTASTALYDRIADVEAIHGHAGRTRVVWLDELPYTGDGGPPIEIQFTAADNATYLRSLGQRQEISDEPRRATP
jgi:hypothetical protein